MWQPVLLSDESFALASVSVSSIGLVSIVLEIPTSMAMVSQVLRESHSSRGPQPNCQNQHCTTTALHSSQIPKASGTNESADNSGGHDGSNSALLFMAPFFGLLLLGFGIIGVKHCLRYNDRNRVGVTDGNRGPFTRENVPRARRRRREKRLMTVDEVNKQFPMMKYRSWASERAREGLPTLGGISVPARRASSTRDTNGRVPGISVKERDPAEQRRPSDGAVDFIPATLSEREGKKDVEKTEPETKQSANPGQTPGTQETSRQVQQGAPNASDPDEDEHIDARLPPECPSTPGDTCAICISPLEDDNDIRALTCGHAFHAECVDLWLTRRRACCPLCNANYYTPKPKPNPEGAPDAATNLRGNNRLDLPGAMRAAWFQGSNSDSSRQGTSLIRLGGESQSQHANRDLPQDQSQRDDAITPAPPVQARPMESAESFNHGMLSPVRPPGWFGRPPHGLLTTQNAESTNQTRTPSQLEARNSEAASSTRRNR